MFKKYSPEENIILVDKPVGPTSFDVIRFLRREMGEKSMGHAGTLDPLASGLMIIGYGRGTKKLNHFLKLPKTYEADILFGTSTLTDDAEGDILEQAVIDDLSRDEIEKVLDGFIGVQEFAVPLFSAIKLNGMALYDYARRKTCPIEIPVKSMDIRSLSLTHLERREDGWHAIVLCDVGSGTYIRSLAREIGIRSGLPAMLAGLRRLTIGDWSVDDAFPLEYEHGILVPKADTQTSVD